MKFPTTSVSLFGWMTALLFIAPAVRATDTAATVAESTDYSQPSVLTATVYAKNALPTDILYKFRRTATRSNNTVRVLREFSFPDGRTAAREQVVYESGRLVFCDLEEPP